MALVAAAMAMAAATMAGCTGQIYSPNGPKTPGASITGRQLWQASGEVREPGNAIDGSVQTAAVGQRTGNGESLTIDLGRPCMFNFVAIDHGPEEMGFARTTVLLTSMDGKAFEYRHAAPGTRRVTSLCPISPILARYVRLQVLVPGERPWSLAEIYIH